MKVQAFLSYSSADKKLAGDIKRHLESFGFEVFLAHDDIAPSNEWQEVIISKLKVCEVFIPLLTDDFATSEFADQEVGFALSRNITILPVKASVNPYGFIGKYQALPLDLANIRQSCLEVAKCVSSNAMFNDRILKGIIQTFGKSGSFKEAERASQYLLEFKDLLSADHVNEILEVAVSNDQIYKSFAAQASLETLIDSFKNQVKPSLIRKYKAKLIS